MAKIVFLMHVKKKKNMKKLLLPFRNTAKNKRKCIFLHLMIEKYALKYYPSFVEVSSLPTEFDRKNYVV